MDVLNSAYADSGLSFNFAGSDYTENTEWFDNASPGTQQQTDMKQALRLGGVADLNIYTVGFTSGERLLGYATFPDKYESDPTDDGVVLLYSSLPDAGPPPFNEGMTAVHEAGHWLGLYHTFQDGCDGEGDYVYDTPSEAEPAFGCPPKAVILARPQVWTLFTTTWTTQMILAWISLPLVKLNVC
ncbi:hypothetical protein B0F90DRAFT_1820010 [Multifurca ochricompacta]|uniref:Peptidase M43 pregnancy-associated plasma-A domain-containing protein n=1 Tax=Multifurca ochricompacta TaxID=376703 RepID=A0AAD4LZH7_9AGAM|nr:hypothetical protein B0F90DRAFT_1820010 [Multifurca ochricompacta]